MSTIPLNENDSPLLLGRTATSGKASSYTFVVNATKDRADAAEARVSVLEQERAVHVSQIKELWDVIERVEWVYRGGGDYMCPWCCAENMRPHRLQCPRQHVLRRLEASQ